MGICYNLYSIFLRINGIRAVCSFLQSNKNTTTQKYNCGETTEGSLSPDMNFSHEKNIDKSILCFVPDKCMDLHINPYKRISKMFFCLYLVKHAT